MRTEDLTVTTSFPVVGRGLFRGDLGIRADTLTEEEAPVVVVINHGLEGPYASPASDVWRLSEQDGAWLHRVVDEDGDTLLWGQPFESVEEGVAWLSRLVWVGDDPYHRRDHYPQVTIWADGDVDTGDWGPRDGAGVVVPAWRVEWMERLAEAMGVGWLTAPCLRSPTTRVCRTSACLSRGTWPRGSGPSWPAPGPPAWTTSCCGPTR